MRAGEAAAFDRYCDWLRTALPARDAGRSSPATTTGPPISCGRWPRAWRCSRLGGAPPPRSAGAERAFTRRATAPAVQLPGPLRRRGAAAGARRAGRHQLHGRGRRRLVPHRRHPRRRHWPGGRGREGRRPHPLRRPRRARRSWPAATEVPVRGVATADGYFPADAVVCNADLPGAYRLVPGLASPRRLRRPALLAVGASCGTPVCAAARGEAVAHHNIHFGERVGRAASAPSSTRASACPIRRSSSACPTLSEPSLAPDGASVLYALEPVPNLTGRVDWSSASARRRRGRPARPPRRASATPSPTSSTSRLVDPTDWARDGHGGGTPFSISHRFFQSGPFRPSNVERRAPGLRVRRLRHRPRHRRPHGARVGPAGRRAGRAGIGPMIDADVPTELDAAYAQLPAAHAPRTAPRTSGPRSSCPRRAARTSTRSTASAATPTTSWTSSTTGPVAGGPTPSPTSATACGRRSPGRGRSTAQPIRSSPPSLDTGRCLRHRPRVLRAVPAVDDDGPHRRPLRDVGRPVRLHGRLGGGHRRDDAAHPRAARRRRLRTGPRARAGVPAHQLPARRRRGPRPRPRLPPVRRISIASTPTPGPAGSRRVARI